jgi:hypothetical protein
MISIEVGGPLKTNDSASAHGDVATRLRSEWESEASAVPGCCREDASGSAGASPSRNSFRVAADGRSNCVHSDCQRTCVTPASRGSHIPASASRRWWRS